MNYSKLKLILSSAALLFATASVNLAIAGPGHDYDSGQAGNSAGAALPRFYAESDLYEVVGVFDGKLIRLYLDHFLTNKPVKAAQVNIDLDGQKFELKESPDNIYEGILPKNLQSDPMPVTVTIIDGDVSDIIATTFINQHTNSAKFSWGLIAKLVIIALVLLAISWVAYSKRRQFIPQIKKILVQIKDRK